MCESGLWEQLSWMVLSSSGAVMKHSASCHPGLRSHLKAQPGLRVDSQPLPVTADRPQICMACGTEGLSSLLDVDWRPPTHSYSAFGPLLFRAAHYIAAASPQGSGWERAWKRSSASRMEATLFCSPNLGCRAIPSAVVSSLEVSLLFQSSGKGRRIKLHLLKEGIAKNLWM